MVFAIHWHEISHGNTWVPHPEPPILFPPHLIPQGCPSAPALSVLPHASNLDGQSISHMVIYMFQCYLSNHPNLAFSQSPKVCSLHLCLETFYINIQCPFCMTISDVTLVLLNKKHQTACVTHTLSSSGCLLLCRWFLLNSPYLGIETEYRLLEIQITYITCAILNMSNMRIGLWR